MLDAEIAATEASLKEEPEEEKPDPSRSDKDVVEDMMSGLEAMLEPGHSKSKG